MLFIIAIESKLYIYLKYKKVIKSKSDFTKYINAYQISIGLLCYHKLNQVLKYNTTNLLNLLSNNNKKDIKLINIKK